MMGTYTHLREQCGTFSTFQYLLVINSNIFLVVYLSYFYKCDAEYIEIFDMN